MPIHDCDHMRRDLDRICNEHASRFACPDALINYDQRFDEYGLIVHDGGRSSIRIMFCPWCGARLPDSKRDRWFDELEQKGVDPSGSDIPDEYRTSAWWNPEI
jgi:hypothetical protein